MRRKSLL